MNREDHQPDEIFYHGKPLSVCGRHELLKLAYDAVRFPQVNHVEFIHAARQLDLPIEESTGDDPQ